MHISQQVFSKLSLCITYLTIDMHSSLVRVHKVNYLSWKLSSFCLKYRCVYSSCSVFWNCMHSPLLSLLRYCTRMLVNYILSSANKTIATLTPFKYVKEFLRADQRTKVYFIFHNAQLRCKESSALLSGNSTI